MKVLQFNVLYTGILKFVDPGNTFLDLLYNKLTLYKHTPMKYSFPFVGIIII